MDITGRAVLFGLSFAVRSPDQRVPAPTAPSTPLHPFLLRLGENHLPLPAQVEDLNRHTDDERNQEAPLGSEQQWRLQISDQWMTVRNAAQGFGDCRECQQERGQCQTDGLDIYSRAPQCRRAPNTIAN